NCESPANGGVRTSKVYVAVNLPFTAVLSWFRIIRRIRGAIAGPTGVHRECHLAHGRGGCVTPGYRPPAIQPLCPGDRGARILTSWRSEQGANREAELGVRIVGVHSDRRGGRSCPGDDRRVGKGARV